MVAVAAAEIPRALAAKKRSGFTVLVYNILYWPYLIVTCAILFWPALALFLLTFFWDRNLRLLHKFTTRWGGHYLRWAPLVTIEMRGREALGEGPYVFVSNHQSMVDILAVFSTHLDFKWVSKVENFYAPFIGWTMALNRYVPLKRGRLPSIMKMYRRCLAWIRKGESLWIFPEGTRSPNGELQSFHRGAFGVAARTGAKIVPVVVVGTESILPKSTARITPQPVTIHILAPIDPKELGGDSRRLRDLTWERMRDELAAMRG